MLDYAMKPKETKNNMNAAAQNKKQSVRQTNCTGIPMQLQERLEHNTGIPLNDVRVHYNSCLPARLDALAYTRGTQVEIGPGQESCLPHELGHVIQQKLGIVRANAKHSSGAALNTDVGLEQQADEIGAGKKINIPASVIGEDVVQRKLFIRKNRETYQKDDLDMASNAAKKLLENTNGALGAASSDPLKSVPSTAVYGKYKEPQYVGNDPQYLEVTKSMKDLLLQGFQEWMSQKGFSLNSELIEIVDTKIESMIYKTVQSANPDKIYRLDSTSKSKVPRLEKGEERGVSYYFESLDEFYTYLMLSKEDHTDQIHWLKINMVNTGAGDAIVMTLPRGYLIVDLGTNLTILLNYLGLRKNKRNNSSDESRGIPLLGAETCIVITHGHEDHKGDFREFSYGKDKILETLIIGANEFAQAGKEDSQKGEMREKIEEFLSSGDFKIYDFGYEKNKQRGLNNDSLVIGRRVGNEEAVILSGDQNPRRLSSAIKIIMSEDQDGNTDTTVDHMMFKVPHHGSKYNNTNGLMKLLKHSAMNTDFMLSSGKLFNHPDANMYFSENKLHRQGSFIYNTDAQNNGETDTRTGRIFYTANLNEDMDDIAQGSIAYKSNGVYRATYTKSYTDTVSNEENENAEEKDKKALWLMIMETLGYTPNPSMDEENLFLKMSVDKQMECIDNISDFNIKNWLLSKVDVSNAASVAPYNFFLTDETKYLGWGQNYFYIMVKTCSPFCLSMLLMLALEDGEFDYLNNILEAATVYGKHTIKLINFIGWYLLGGDFSRLKEDTDISNSNAQEVFEASMDQGSLEFDMLHIDPQNIYKMLCNRDGMEDSDAWLTERLAFVNVLDKKHQIMFFSFLLTCGSLHSEEIKIVFDKLNNDFGHEVLAEIDSSVFLQLIRMYPESSEYILNVYETIPNGYRQEDEESNGIDWYTIYSEILENNQFVWSSVEDLGFWLDQSHMIFPEYISKLLPEAFQKDIENNNVLLHYAWLSGDDQVEYMAALFESAYENDKKGDLLTVYFTPLLDHPDGISILFSSWNLLMPNAREKCFDVSIKNEPILKNLLIFTLSAIVECGDAVQPVENSTESMAYDFLAYLILHKDVPGYITDMIDVNGIIKFYNVFEIIHPELVSTIFACHFTKVFKSGNQFTKEFQEMTSTQQALMDIIKQLGIDAQKLFDGMSVE